jgi:hypothetical protein
MCCQREAARAGRRAAVRCFQVNEGVRAALVDVSLARERFVPWRRPETHAETETETDRDTERQRDRERKTRSLTTIRNHGGNGSGKAGRKRDGVLNNKRISSYRPGRERGCIE